MSNTTLQVRRVIANARLSYWLDYVWDLFVDKLMYNGENAKMIQEFYFGDLRRSK